MEAISNFIVRHRKIVVAVTLLVTVICTALFFQVKINYDMTDYLPEEANSTIAMDRLSDEFGESIPNCNVRVENVSIQEALQVKEKLEAMDGVEDVQWLDDVADTQVPLEAQDADLVDDYYKDGNALFIVTIADGQEMAVTEQIPAQLGENVLLSGTAADQADTQKSVLSQATMCICILLPLILIILLLFTTSWLEPFIYLLTIGAAVLINLGTDLFRGEISYMTMAVVPVLQIAVSLDYAVFLSSSFNKHRQTAQNDTQAMKLAMKDSLKSIASGALTTIFGFAALTLMDFQIGPDMGISLVKGVILSFILCMTFLPAMILLCNKWIQKTRHRRLIPDCKGAAKIIMKIALPVMVSVAAICVVCYPAQNQNAFLYGTTAEETEATQIINAEFGKKNTMVLLVPNTDRNKENALGKEIEQMDHVTDVISYTTQVGSEIPPEYLSSEITDNFYSENYARIIIYSDLPDECDESFVLVEQVRSAAANYYGADAVYSCGQSANLYDMKHTVNHDNTIVNLVTVIAIYIILAIMTKSWFLPLPLILAIKACIWINMSIPYFTGSPLIYIGYLVVSTIQMGATIDYAILLTDNYMKNRQRLPKKKAMLETVRETIPSVLVSAAVLAMTGFTLSLISTDTVVSSLGVLIGRGALIPLLLVLVCLPALLMLIDKIIPYTTWKANFLKEKQSEGDITMIQVTESKQKEVSEFLGPVTEESFDDCDDSVYTK